MGGEIFYKDLGSTEVNEQKKYIETLNSTKSAPDAQTI